MDELNPIYRIEYFLDAWLNSTTPPEPIYRIEYYLAALAGADVVIPEPIFRIEKYLAKLCGEDVELPEEPIYRIEKYLAKMCNEDVTPPEPIYRVEFWLDALAEGEPTPILKTAVGNPIHITDALARAVNELKVAFAPVQSGSGDPSSDNVRPISGWTGANVYDEAEYDQTATPKLTVTWQTEAGTVYGGYLRINEDGSVDLVGTLAGVDLGSLTWTYASGSFNLRGSAPAGILSPSTTSATPSALCSYYPVKSYLDVAYNDQSMTIVFATSSASGHVWVHDTTYSDAGTFKTAVTGQKLVYELATPVEYDLADVTPITLLANENNLWSDTNGDLTLSYYADGNVSTIEALNTLLGGRYVNNHGEDEPSDEEALQIIMGETR